MGEKKCLAQSSGSVWKEVNYSALAESTDVHNQLIHTGLKSGEVLHVLWNI